MSRVTAIISAWLSASSSACHGLLIITVITPLPTKPSATKMPENWSWRTRQLLTCRCQRDVAALDANTRRELADAKAENDALRDDAAAGRRRLHIKAVCQSVREATTASGVDNAASPRLADTAERDYFTLRERLITMQNNWKEPRSILMSSVDRVAHIEWATHAIIAWVIHTRFQREYKCLKHKTEQSIYECLLGFCFNNTFCAATNFGCIDSFLLPNSRNEEMMGDGFLWCYCCRFVLNSKRLLSILK